MAALDFPASPAVNDTYTANGITYIWTGVYWKVSAYPSGASVSPAIAAGTNTATTGTVVFGSSAGNVTFGMDTAGYVTASVAAAGGGIALSAGTNSTNTGTVQFANSNGISFGMNTTGVVTASYTVPTQTVDTNKAGTGFSSTTTAGTAIVGTNNTNGLSIAVPQFLTTAQPVGAYLTTARASNDAIGLNTALTANGLSVTANSSGLSINVPAWITTYVAQTTQTQPAGNIVGAGFTSTTTGGTAVVGTNNSNGLSLGVPQFITTYVNDLTSGRAGTGTSLNLTNLTGTLNVDTNGVALSLSANVGGGGGDGYNIIGVNGGATQLSTTYQLSNANNVTFGLNAGTITASASYVNDLTSGRAGTGFTSASTAGTDVVATLNTNGLSVGIPKYITTYVAQTTQPVAISGSNGSFTYGTVTFGSSNGMHFYTTNGSVVGSYTVPTQTVDTNKAGTGFTSTTTAGTAVVGTLNTNGLSIGVPTIITNALTTAAQSNHSHNFATTTTNGSLIVVATTNSAGATIAVPSFITTYAAQTNQTANFYAAGNTTQLSSTAGVDVRSLSFEGAGIASVGVSNGRVLVSVPSGGGAGDGVNIVQMDTNAGNTSGATFSTISGTMYLQGGNNITLSQTSNTIVISAGAGGGGGNQLSRYLAYPIIPLAKSSSSMVSGTSGAGSTSAAFYVNPLYVDRDINAQEIEMLFSNGALSAGTGSCTVGYHLGFYILATTGGTTQLVSVSTFSAAAYISQNSATAQTIFTYWGSTSTANSTQTSGNISAAFMTAGLRDIKLYDASFTLPASTYYLVHGLTMRSSSVNIGASLVTGMYAAGLTNHAYLGQSTMGAPIADRYIGSFTSQVTGAAGNTLSMSMPASVNTTAITVSTSNAGRWLYPRMYN